MQWLIALDTEDDPIPACRLMNIFRRKAVKIATLTLAAKPAGYSLVAVVETLEAEVEHIFNFLRRTEGVEHVTCYRHEPSRDASFVFIDAGLDSSRAPRLLESLPGSKLVFASHGKYLLEIPAESRSRPAVAGFDGASCLPFSRVMTTREAARPELVEARAS